MSGASKKVIIVESEGGGASQKIAVDNALLVGGTATEGQVPIVQADESVEWGDPAAGSSKWEADGDDHITPTDNKRIKAEIIDDLPDTSSWEADGLTAIQPADSKTVSMANFTETATRKIMTDAERAAIAVNSEIAVNTLTHGFIDRSETTESFNETTYEYTLTDAGAGWSYYRDGVLHTITGNKSVRLVAEGIPAADTYYIYIDSADGTLLSSTTGWNLENSRVPVDIVSFNNALTPKHRRQDERHTSAFNKNEHAYEHLTFGTRFQAGGIIGNYQVAQTTPAEAHNTYSMTASTLRDEDIKVVSEVLPVAGPYQIEYRTGASTWEWLEQAIPFKYTNAGYIQYDNNGTMTQGGPNNFYVTYHLATNVKGVGSNLIIHGQAEHATIGAARLAKFEDLNLSGFDVAEAVALYKIIWEAKSAYNTTGKVRMAEEPERLEIGIGGVGAPVTTVAAGDVSVDSSGFDKNLTTADNDVQKALETLDQLEVTAEGAMAVTKYLAWSIFGGI